MISQMQKQESYLQRVTHANYIVRDHLVHQIRTLPGVTLLDMVYRLSLPYLGTQAIELRNILFIQPIVTSPQFDQEVNVTFTPEPTHVQVRVTSRKVRGDQVVEPEWQANMECTLFTRQEQSQTNKIKDIKSMMNQADQKWDMDDVYGVAREADINHYTFMKTLGTVYRRGQEEIMELQLGELSEQYRSKFYAHPAFLDGSTFAGYSFRLSGERSHYFDEGKAYIPFMIGRFCIYKTLPSTIYTYTHRSAADEANVSGALDVFSTNLEIRDAAGELLVEFERLTLKRIRELQSIQRLVELEQERAPSSGRETLSVSVDKELSSVQTDPDAARNVEEQEPVLLAEAYLREQIGVVLNTAPTALNTQTGFYDLGLDSTELLGLVKLLERRLEAQLYPTLLFEYATIERLSEYLADQYAEAFRQSNDGHEGRTEGRYLDKAANPDSSVDEDPKAAASTLANKQGDRVQESTSSTAASLTDAHMMKQQRAGEDSASGHAEAVDHELLLYKRQWERVPNSQSVGWNETNSHLGDLGSTASVKPGVRQKLWLFGAASQLRTSLQSVLSAEAAADVEALDSELTTVPARLELMFKQALEHIQHELQQRTTEQVRYLVVADMDDELGPYAAALEAMLKTASLEQPRIGGKVILVDGLLKMTMPQVIKLLQQESNSISRGEETVLYKGTTRERHIRQWVPIPHYNRKQPYTLESPEQSELAYKPNGTYVITGGLGGLGLLVAEHITAHFPVKLALIGRSTLGPEQEERVRRLREQGSEVIVLQADMGNDAEVTAAFSRIKDQFGTVNGIIHSAGVIRDEYIVRKNTDELSAVFHPKVHGLYALDQASREERLDFFVLFSSISAVIGNIGQADYASANAIMDVFAAQRDAQVRAGARHGATVSFNWPLWANGGMRIDAQMERMLFASSGLRPLPNEAGLQALDAVLAADTVQAVVLYGAAGVIQDTFMGNHASQPLSSFSEDTSEIEVSYGPDDIAVIGLSGRYPLAGNVEQFERNLLAKRDCVTGFPQDRWEGHSFGYEVDHFYKFGGFVDDIDKFDPLFFNMSPRQAETTDPQARLFLQAAWEACEDAGYYQDRAEHHYVSGGEHTVGVFAGVFWSHYELFGADLAHQGVPMSFGNSPAAIANLVSYSLNLHGPSMAVDTMCSSSLTAIHLARESIRSGECHFALAGGVNLVTHPHKYMFLKQAQFLSSDGRCRSFGEGGDGYVPGEGIGAVLLTTVARAEREGYPIYGIIKGSAINHVGKTSGATVPDPIAQSEVIKEALGKSAVNPRTISYVEAHGTGTSLGDPIEIQGLNRAYSAWTKDKQFCAIGSSKSNIGHLEAAAGIAGLTKLLLQLKRGELFPSLHAEDANPFIPFTDTPFYLERDGGPWQRPELAIDGELKIYSRRAGLSSFGAFGSNAHLVVEEYVPNSSRIQPNRSDAARGEQGAVVIPLSARSEDRLLASAQQLLYFLTKQAAGVDQVPTADLREQVKTDILQQLGELLHVAASELDAAHYFLDQNVDHLLRHRLSERLAELWELSDWEGCTYKASSVNELVDLLLEHDWEKFADIYEASVASTGPAKAGSIHVVENGEYQQQIHLSELAYTLQVGREAMAVRLACVVSSIDELIRKLTELVAGIIPSSSYRSEGAMMQSAVPVELRSRMSQNELCSAAEQWVKGARLNWRTLYVSSPRRIHLPTYPFAGDKYWVPKVEQADAVLSHSTQVPTAAGTVLHPLLHRNTSDLTEQRFSSRFTGEEGFLADHVINGRSVLPAAACLEMVRAAVFEAAAPLMEQERRLTFKHVVWTRPIVINGNEGEIHIGLFAEDNGGIAFEIYGKESETSFTQGSVTIGTEIEQPRIQLERLLETTRPSRWSTEQYYSAFQQAGLEYGAEHRCMEQIFLGTDAAIVKLRLPERESGSAADAPFMLHPGLLDASLQATLVLIQGLTDSLDELPQVTLTVPYALHELNMFDTATSTMWAIARFSANGPSSDTTHTFDIDVCDEAGNVLWRLLGLSARTIKAEASGVGVLVYEPTWRASDLPVHTPHAAPWTRHDILLCGLEDIDDRLLTDQMTGAACLSLRTDERHLGLNFQYYAIHLLEHIQRVLTAGGTDKVLLQVVIPTTDDGKLLAGLSAMLRTAHLEHPRLLWQLVEFDHKPESVASNLASSANTLAELAHLLSVNAIQSQHGDLHIRYRHNKRYVQEWKEHNTQDQVGKVPWQNEGVYLVTGGTGGLGQIVAKDILNRAERPIVVLTGRSPLDERVQDKLSALRNEAPLAVIEYMQTDVADRSQVDTLMNVIHARYGKLNGIIHSAGVTRDSYILKKTPSELTEVFAAKTRGIVHLDQASRHFPLDLFIIFGSLAGALGNAGQADYAAANAFASAYAKLRTEAVQTGLCSGSTLTLDWPLWQEGGMTVDVENEKRLRHHLGIIPMRTASGIKALYDGLSLQAPHLIVLEGDLAQMRTRMTGNERGTDRGAKQTSGWNEAAAATAVAATTSGETGGSGRHASLVTTAIEETLARLVSQLLKVKPQDIEPQLKLSDYGFDSVTFTELTNRLNEQFKVDLTPAIFFEYATIQSFADYMVKEHYETIAQLLLPSEALSEELLNKAGSLKAVDELDIAPLPRRARFAQNASNVSTSLHRSTHTHGTEHTARASASDLSGVSQYQTRPLISAKQALADPLGGRSASNQQALPGQVAIIGMSGKFPMADDLEELWANLLQGKDCITEIPADRWDWQSYFGDPAMEPNKSNVKWGGFLNGIAEFDPQFFGISPREAELMDPQQRLLMTYAWKALEDAGYAAASLAGSDTGLFVGTASSGYSEHVYRAGLPIEGYTSTGSVSSVGPNRISYFMDLHGPSEPIETACSSSLVALDRAVAAIQNGSCRMAIVGGVNTILSPEPHISFNKAGMLSEDGRCKTFSAAANGYVRGEGVGMLVLKGLDEAERDGDTIHGVIRATAVNHGGRAQSLTAPNPKAQAALLQAAYGKAGIDPRTVTYIEAHGTGTELGDPIEINGLKAAFQALYEKSGLPATTQSHCGLGSIKTNIGHLELAAGVAGVIKVLLQIKHQTLVQSLHCDEVNPYIQLKDSPFYIVQHKQEWTALRDEYGNVVPRRAGVSSFGFGGVNAHAVIEEYIPPIKQKTERTSSTEVKPVVVVLSARNEERLRDQAAQWLTYLDAGKLEDSELANAAYTLQTGRQAFEERIGIVVASVQQLRDKLMLYVSGEESISGLYRGHTKRSKDLVSLFADEDLKLAVEAWFAKDKHHKLAEIWARGLDMDWKPMYQRVLPQRLSLPTYVFAREHYWVGQRKSVSARSESVGQHSHHEHSVDASQRNGQRLPTAEASIQISQLGQSLAAMDAVGHTTQIQQDTLRTESSNRQYEQTASRDALQRSFASTEPGAPSPAVQVHTAAKPTGIKLKPTSNRPPEVQHSSAAERSTVKLRPLSNYTAEKNLHGVTTAAQAVSPQYGELQLGNERLSRLPNVGEPPVGESLTSVESQDQTYEGYLHQTTVKSSPEAASMLAQRLRQELTSSLAEALYLSAADIDTDKPFIEMGLDSIIGVEWMRTINRCYGTTIAATKVYDYPNVRDLASYLANQLHQAQAGTLSNQTTAEHKTISETRSISSSVAGISIPDISTGSRQMLQELTETLAEALYLTIDKVDTEVKFIDLGLDSIVGVEWLRAVNRQYGTTVTATKLYDYPTLREFATYHNSQLSDYDGSQPSVDHVLQQVQAGKLDIQQAEKLLMTLGGV